MTINSPSGHRARKRFGQNFLHDANVIQKIVKAIAPKEGQHLVEIGPGKGALTAHLAKRCTRLDLIELDRDLLPGLQSQFATRQNVKAHQADALKFDFTSLLDEQKTPLRVVGNLPYNISTPLLFHLLSNREIIADMYFMLQKEVVERLAAAPGDKPYGRLSVMAQYYCGVEPLFYVAPSSFSPVPKVESAVVKLSPYKVLPHQAKNINMLDSIVKFAFQQRRKTLKNALKPLLSNIDENEISLDLSLRAERISLAEFVQLSDLLSAKCSPTEITW